MPDGVLDSVFLHHNGGNGGSGSRLLLFLTSLEHQGDTDKEADRANGNQGLEDVLYKMLTKTSYPTLTAPSASITYTGPTVVKVGSNVGSTSIRVNFNRGSISPAYGTNGYRAGAASSYSMKLEGSSATQTDSNNTGVFQIQTFTRNSKGSVTITGTVSYSAGQQPKDSDGNNYSSPLTAGSVTGNATIQFILPFVFGVSDTPNLTSFENATEKLETKSQKTFKYTPNNQHPYIAYDADFGTLKKIQDQNGFDVTSGWSTKTLSIGGVAYRVYVANIKVTSAAEFTFIF